jgi:hypothetical protein
VTRGRASLAAYRRALRLYPKAFREEYGDDLVLLLAHQLDDEATSRVLARTAVDLALTVPARHLEAHMRRAPAPVVPLLYAALALSSIVVALVVGRPIVLLACTAVGVTAGCLGLAAAFRARPPTEPLPASASWWKLLAVGAGLLAALIAVTRATGELPEHGWFIAMITLLASLILLGLGVALGVAHLARRGVQHPAA